MAETDFESGCRCRGRYRNVRAAVVAGELTARPWQVDLSGVGRSLKATGDGEYDLRAKLLAGQVTIRSD